VPRAAGWSVAVALASTGCAGKPASKTPAVDVERHTSASTIPFDVSEVRALEAIAASDPRFARRLPEPPNDDLLHGAAMAALTHGDPDVSVLGSALDFSSFTARARALDEAQRALGTQAPEPPLEGELARRLLAEERARLAEESLPAGAGAFVRALTETESIPPSPASLAARDEWLANKLDQVRESLRGVAQTRSALAALDGTLDPLERMVLPEQMPGAARALAQLRVALGDAASPPPSAGGETNLEASIHAHLGGALDVAAVRARLMGAQTVLLPWIKGVLAHADERTVARRADARIFAEGACNGDPRASRIRAMLPPPERAPICGALSTLRESTDDAGLAVALVALHDEATVALWAIALRVDGATTTRATAAAHTFFGAEPDREARLARYAESRPVEAIGAGLAAELLTRTSATPADARAAAARWLSFGDAPLDVVERELFSAAPPRPASPRP
jgi:hypothetical protein